MFIIINNVVEECLDVNFKKCFLKFKKSIKTYRVNNRNNKREYVCSWE